jgi:hypothetical protein
LNQTELAIGNFYFPLTWSDVAYFYMLELTTGRNLSYLPGSTAGGLFPEVFTLAASVFSKPDDVLLIYV